MSKRILVVEDDPVTRRLEESILVNDGYVVDTAAETPLLMVPATIEPHARQRSFEVGVVMFRAKPFTAATFRSTVQSLVG